MELTRTIAIIMLSYWAASPVFAVEALDDTAMGEVAVGTGDVLNSYGPTAAGGSGEVTRDQNSGNQNSLGMALRLTAPEQGRDNQEKGSRVGEPVPASTTEQPVRRVTLSPAGNDGRTTTLVMPGENILEAGLIEDPRYKEAGLKMSSTVRVQEVTLENVRHPQQPSIDFNGNHSMIGLEVSSETMLFQRY